MMSLKEMVQLLKVESICLGEDAEIFLEDADTDEEITVADNDGFFSVLVSDPGIFIPDLNICAMNAIVCDNKTGMSDWSGTALFTLTEKGFSYQYIEQDSLLPTLLNVFKKDASRMQAFVLKGVTNQITIPKEHSKQPVVIPKEIQFENESGIQIENIL